MKRKLKIEIFEKKLEKYWTIFCKILRLKSFDWKIKDNQESFNFCAKLHAESLFIGKVSDNQENLKICAKLHKSHFFEKVASVENAKCLRFPER